jgi:rubrerythrin
MWEICVDCGEEWDRRRLGEKCPVCGKEIEPVIKPINQDLKD